MLKSGKNANSRRLEARARNSRLSVCGLLATLLVLLIGGGCAPSGPQPSGGTVAAANVVVILSDAMRADRLGPYGFDQRSTTPHLDRLAASGTVFEQVISQTAWTVPSVASLFTGVDPQAHRVRRFIDPKKHAGFGDGDVAAVQLDAMSLAHDTLAERFQAAGYQTVAVVKSDVINAGRGFDQGFDAFHFIGQKPKEHGDSGQQLTDRILAWLSAERDPERPFFLYLHYMDVHASYRAPTPYFERWLDPESSSQLNGNHGQIVPFDKGEKALGAGDLRRLLALYDAEITYWDAQLGRLLAALDGLGGDTVIAVVADHGEAFFEHGGFFHHDLYQENIHVPLVIKAPTATPRRVAGWLELTDLPPTLAELAGIEAAEQWTGSSLAAAVRGGSANLRPVYCEYGRDRTMIDTDGLKLILRVDRAELYDLRSDPTESHDLAAERPADVARLTALIEQRLRRGNRLSQQFPQPEPQDLSAEQEAAIRALGYL